MEVIQQEIFKHLQVDQRIQVLEISLINILFLHQIPPQIIQIADFQQRQHSQEVVEQVIMHGQLQKMV